MANKQTAIASPLKRKALLVSLTISQWSARKLDRKITTETNKRYAATEDAGRYNKLLIGGSYLAELQGLVSEARLLHYRVTRPWADEGPRILPNALYENFSNNFRELKQKFEVAKKNFIRVYPEAVKQRQKQLNGAFDPADYPSVEEMEHKFQMTLRFMPLPDADDFRSDLDSEIVEDIRQEIAEASDQAVAGAMKATIEQIIATVGHMAERLKDYKPAEVEYAQPTRRKSGKGKRTTLEKAEGVFRDSLVKNVRELVDLLPAFNLTNDPELDKITKRMAKELCAEDADELRKNDKARKSVAKSADDILADVSKFLS
jgi:hypothetical protein